jgi:hypothetical protein
MELASTDWGSYSPLKHWTFVRTRDPRLICLATVALPSALSFSFLTNATAYEAIGFNIANVTQKVETLYGLKDDAPSKVISGIIYSAQDIELSAQLTRSLHNIPPEIGTTNTSHQAVLNVSSQSLSRISKSAKRLFNVPVYQLAASCKPADIRDFQVQFDSREESYAEFHIRIKIASKLADFKGRGRNMAPSMKGQLDIGVARPLVAFKDEKIWIGWFYYTEEKDTATYLTDYR